MKRSFYSLLLLMLFLQAGAQSVTIQPLKPQRGDTITLSYDPQAAGAVIGPQANAVTLVFSYSTFYDLPAKIRMQRQGDHWSTSFVAGRFATFASFTLQNGAQVQKTAAGRHFSIPVFQDGKRVKNSLLHESYSLSAQSLKSAGLAAERIGLIEKELDDYPGNYEAALALLTAKMAVAKTAAEKSVLRTEARKIIAAKLEENPTSTANLNLVTMGYLMIGEKTRTDSVRNVVMERFPDADISKSLLAGRIAGIKASPEKAGRLELLLSRSRPGEESFLTIHSLLFDYYASVKNAVKALEHASFLAKEDNPYTARTLKEIADTLTKNQIAPFAAINYAGMALDRVEQYPAGIIRYFPEFGYIPAFVPDSTRYAVIAAARSALLAVQALNYVKLGQQQQALKLAQQAVSCGNGREGLITSAAVFDSLGRPEQAFNTLWKVLSQNPSDSLALRMARNSFLKFNSSADKFQDSVASLEKLELYRLRQKLSAAQLHQPGPDLSGLVDLNGKPVNTSAWKGKIIVLDFWATWCVPCMKEMPYLHQVYQKYKDRPDVLFMVVNSGSGNTIEDARKWVKQNSQYQFPVYYNTDKTIGEKAGFSIIPTIILLDKSGNMQFRTTGFEGEILEKKLGLEIDLLSDGREVLNMEAGGADTVR